MKKIFYLLIGLLLILPTMVKADMSSPTVLQYKVTVNNPNGIDEYKEVEVNDYEYKYEKTGKKIPYGTTFITFDDGDDTKGFIKGPEDYEYVNIKDLVAVEKEFKLDKKYLGDEIEKYVIKETEIKSGPAKAYETIGKIKAGETIKIRSMILDEKNYFESAEYKKGKTEDEINDEQYADDFNPWYYVEYNGIKGYVSVLEESLAVPNLKDQTIIFLGDTDIYDLNSDKVIKKFKTFDKITGKASGLNQWTDKAYIESSNFKGYTTLGSIAVKWDNKTFIILEDTNVYSTRDYYLKDSNGKLIWDKDNNEYKEDESLIVTTLKPGTTLIAEYFSGDTEDGRWYEVYYEKDGIKGYLELYDAYSYDFKNKKFEQNSIQYQEKKTFITPKKTNLYESPNLDSKVISTIPANTSITSELYGSNFVYYEKDGVKGWIIDDYIIGDYGTQKFIIDNDMNIYDSLDSDRKVITTIPANTEFKSKYFDSINKISYYEKDNVKGWIDYSKSNNIQKEEQNKQENDKPKEETIIKKKNNNIIYICIGAGVVLSITAVVTIILINKKKKQKEL